MSQNDWQDHQDMWPSPTADDVLHEMRSAVQETMPPGERIQRALEVAAHRLGIEYSRAWALWYRKARQVRAEEADTIRQRLAHQRRLRLGRLRAEVARLEALERGHVGDTAAPPSTVETGVAEGPHQRDAAE